MFPWVSAAQARCLLLLNFRTPWFFKIAVNEEGNKGVRVVPYRMQSSLHGVWQSLAALPWAGHEPEQNRSPGAQGLSTPTISSLLLEEEKGGKIFLHKYFFPEIPCRR